MKKSEQKKQPQIYCSLDIETSDFDPANGEILELGMVFFEVQKNGFSILSEWQSTFKANKEVPARILALTGIATEELENSPQFREKAKEIQKLVKGCIIVGHNINFDIKFLESFGIKFSGKQIDTLDLAQMLLPTNPSYNLEALMNLLNVSHKDAHRALADAKAAMVVLQTLLQYYSSFPAELKKELEQIFPQRDFPEINLLLQTEFAPREIQLRQSKVETEDSPEVQQALKQEQAIMTFPLGFNHHNYIFGALQKSKEKILLVVNNKQSVYQLWKQKLAYPIFDNKEVFNLEAYLQLIKQDLAVEQRFFLGKLAVWRHLNWQSKVLVDVNFSFGSQFKALINCSAAEELAWPLEQKLKVVATDYADFINFELDKIYADRKLVILDLNNFEQSLTFVTSKKVSWNDFLYTLKQVYDPITKLGKSELKKEVTEALSQVDLFFGLASLQWKKIDSNSPQILVNEKMEDHGNYQIIKKAGESFIGKMRGLNEKINSERISEYLISLESFFINDSEQIRWVEVSEGRLMFSISPLRLELIAAKKLEPFKKVIFTASLGSEALIKYFTHRLNLGSFDIRNIGQQELRKKFEVIISNAPFSVDALPKFLEKINLPAALLLPNSSTLKNFYEANFKTLSEKYKVAAQGYSGGTNKLLDNFSIHENALLLATDHLILRSAHKRLRVKDLILTRLPFEQFNHPLFAAQAERYPNQFIDFNIPRALYNFHSIIRFFYSNDLERIFILDQKIHKEYGQYFIDYLKTLPFVELRYE